LRSTPLSNDEFQVAAQLRFGVLPLTCLKPFINEPLKSDASAPDNFVDAFGSNIKTCGGRGWRHDGKPQLVRVRHLSVVPPGPDPTPGGRERRT